MIRSGLGYFIVLILCSWAQLRADDHEHPRTLYVDPLVPVVSAGNGLTPERPLRSLQAALGAAIENDEILLAPAAYQEGQIEIAIPRLLLRTWRGAADGRREGQAVIQSPIAVIRNHVVLQDLVVEEPEGALVEMGIELFPGPYRPWVQLTPEESGAYGTEILDVTIRGCATALRIWSDANKVRGLRVYDPRYTGIELFLADGVQIQETYVKATRWGSSYGNGFRAFGVKDLRVRELFVEHIGKYGVSLQDVGFIQLDGIHVVTRTTASSYSAVSFLATSANRLYLRDSTFQTVDEVGTRTAEYGMRFEGGNAHLYRNSIEGAYLQGGVVISPAHSSASWGLDLDVQNNLIVNHHSDGPGVAVEGVSLGRAGSVSSWVNNTIQSQGPVLRLLNAPNKMPRLELFNNIFLSQQNAPVIRGSNGFGLGTVENHNLFFRRFGDDRAFSPSGVAMSLKEYQDAMRQGADSLFDDPMLGTDYRPMLGSPASGGGWTERRPPRDLANHTRGYPQDLGALEGP